MFTGVQKVSIYDPATGTTVQLNKIAPDADVKIKAPIELLDVNHNLYYDGDESYIEFASFDIEKFYQLETWMIAHTPVRLVAAGLDYNIFWEESVNLTVRKTYGFQIGNRNMMIIKMQKERGTHSIYAVTNFVRKLGRFVDANANEKADNLSFAGIGTYAFDDATAYQQITGGIGGDTASTGLIVFPVSGLTLYAKMNLRATGGPAMEWDFYLQALDYSGSILGTSTVSDSDDVLSLLLPANTYRVRITIAVDGTYVVRFFIPYLGMQRGNYLDVNF